MWMTISNSLRLSQDEAARSVNAVMPSILTRIIELCSGYVAKELSKEISTITQRPWPKSSMMWTKSRAEYVHFRLWLY